VPHNIRLLKPNIFTDFLSGPFEGRTFIAQNIKMNKKQNGQTLIETALMLFLLLLILLGISEFARAWYVKSSLKNGVRQGARVAAVTSPLASFSGFACPSKSSCPLANAVQNAVCCQPGVPEGTTVDLNIDMTTEIPTDVLNSGDTITVIASTTFTYIVGGSPWPWPSSTILTTDASMRYEE
jgi:Flp pilus assembly protein TadG